MTLQQVDIYALGRILFEFLYPEGTQQDLDLFKVGILNPSFIGHAVRQLIMDTTTEDIEARLEASEVVARVDSILPSLRNASN